MSQSNHGSTVFDGLKIHSGGAAMPSSGSKPSKNPILQVVGIVMGGAGGLAIAVVGLRLFFGMDLLAEKERPAKPSVLAQNRERVDPLPQEAPVAVPAAPTEQPTDHVKPAEPIQPEQPPETPVDPGPPVEFNITPYSPLSPVEPMLAVAESPADPATPAESPTPPPASHAKPSGPFFAAGQSWIGIWSNLSPRPQADLAFGAVKLDLAEVSASSFAGTYHWTSRAAAGTSGSGSSQAAGSRRGTMIQWEAGSPMGGTLKNDVLIATVHSSETDKSELWAIPTPLAIAPEVAAGEYRIKEGTGRLSREFLVTVNADGTAERKSVPPAAGIWTGTDKQILIAWLDGSRDAWQIESSAGGKVQIAKRTTYKLGQSVGVKGAAGGSVERVEK